MQQSNNIKVAVTGANGYIASHIIKLLLEQEYQVIGTVRNLEDKYKYQHLYELKNSQKNLILKQASLDSNENDFINIFQDCQCIFHTASPVFFKGTEEQIVTPAVNGTQKILDAIKLNSKTIKNLIYTSSMGSVKTYNQPLHNNTYTNQDWSDIPKMKEYKNYYQLSKTLVEQMIKKFGELNPNIATVSINPTVVQGPTLSNIKNFSLEQGIIKPITQNNYDIGEQLFYKIIDVRDLAQIHINVFQQNKKNERYIAIGDDFTIEIFTECLAKSIDKFKLNYQIKTQVSSQFGLENYQFKHDSSQALQLLGKPFNKLQQILDDTVESLVQKNLI